MAKLEQYKELLLKLLPKGKLWQFNVGTVNYKLLEGTAVELTRVDDRIEKLILEQDPRTTSELISEWETEFGLPDSCTVLGGTLSERRTNLIAKMRARGGQSASYFVSLFAAQGTTITIDIYEPSYVPMSIPAEITGDAPLFTWHVNVPSFQVDWFEAGDSAEDYAGRFLSSNNVACIIEKYKPAYTHAVYHYGA